MIGCLSLAVVLSGGSGKAGRAGLIFMLIGPVLTIYYTVMGRKGRKFENISAHP